jgi:hypothetical protein
VPGPVFLSNDQETDLDKQDKNWESNHTKWNGAKVLKYNALFYCHLTPDILSCWNHNPNLSHLNYLLKCLNTLRRSQLHYPGSAREVSLQKGLQSLICNAIN